MLMSQLAQALPRMSMTGGAFTGLEWGNSGSYRVATRAYNSIVLLVAERRNLTDYAFDKDAELGRIALCSHLQLDAFSPVLAVRSIVSLGRTLYLCAPIAIYMLNSSYHKPWIRYTREYTKGFRISAGTSAFGGHGSNEGSLPYRLAYHRTCPGRRRDSR